jgi:hypothetical protein
VELEKDLALQRQLLDVVIIEQTAPGGSAQDLHDGLEQLRAHNLLTYKSKQEALDDWALDELAGSLRFDMGNADDPADCPQHH